MEQQFAYYSKLVLVYLPWLDIVLVLALLLCLAGLPLLAVSGQSLAYSRGRGAYDKCAHQLGSLGGWLGLVTIVTGALSLGMRHESLLTLDMKNFVARENFLPLVLMGGWLCVVFSTVLNWFYVRLWQSLRSAPRLRQLLGFLAALTAAAAVYAALLSLHAHVAGSATPVSSTLRTLFVPDAEDFWVAVSYAPFASLALAGGYGALWLLLRRVVDDYGRDHYNLVIPWCAGWARNSWLLLWLFVAGRAAWRVFQLYAAVDAKLDWIRFVPGATCLLALLPPGLWWLGLSRGTAPLRAKIAIFLAPLWATGCLLLLDLGLR